MAKAFSFQIQGLDKLQKKIKDLPQDLREEIDDELKQGMVNVELKAASRVRKDNAGGGGLASSIFLTGQNLEYELAVNKEYAAYVEFGTGGYVFQNQPWVDDYVKDIAIQFKGAGVREVNIKPQPFFFNSFFEERPKIIKAVKEAIERASK